MEIYDTKKVIHSKDSVGSAFTTIIRALIFLLLLLFGSAYPAVESAPITSNIYVDFGAAEKSEQSNQVLHYA